jgi:VWFA-related protein
MMAKQSGRKALVLLTDGADRGSKTPLEEAVRAAQRADTLAYSVRIADDAQRSFGGGPRRGGGAYESADPKKVLQQLSRETGGAYFEAGKKKAVQEIYAEIEDELRNQYSIGYTPDKALSEGGYRKLQVTVDRKGCVVQTRDGYYAHST